MDVAVITQIAGYWNRLIHDKENNRFIWNRMANIETFKKREKALTAAQWARIPEVYVKKKNLHINDDSFPSFKCYIEAVNEIYSQYH